MYNEYASISLLFSDNAVSVGMFSYILCVFMSQNDSIFTGFYK